MDEPYQGEGETAALENTQAGYEMISSSLKY